MLLLTTWCSWIAPEAAEVDRSWSVLDGLGASLNSPDGFRPVY